MLRKNCGGFKLKMPLKYRGKQNLPLISQNLGAILAWVEGQWPLPCVRACVCDVTHVDTEA